MDSNKIEFENTLLKSLGPHNLIEIRKVLEPVRLDRTKFIERAGAPASYLYVIENGVASTVARMGKREIEIAITGREGVTGTALILGADISPHDCYMQVAGSGYRLSVDNLRRLMAESQTLTAKTFE